MKIFLYNTISPSNTINKELTDEVRFDIVFKDIADINNPTIKLSSRQLIQFNYCYIPDFKRYYFINNISTTPKNLYILSLTCDVLESYKDDILASSGLVARNKDGNKYYDGEYLNEIRQEHLMYFSDTTLEFEENIILVTIGG